jgi:putative ABC transport system permease protein
MIIAITLITSLPIVLQKLVDESDKQLTARALSTPLLVGIKGSSLDIVMNTLYFQSEQPETMTMAESYRIDASNLADAIPVYSRFKARDYPVIGTTLEYFEFRNLSSVKGKLFGLLGDCVLGYEVAEKLGLQPGDSLVSSPENPFDLAGIYPLKMKVTGILNISHTPDDKAVFVDLKTAWVIKGLGHGHQNLAEADDPRVLLGKEKNRYTANAKLYHYTEITEDNIGSFHFHGDKSNFPITAVIAVPHDQKSGVLLMGRYLAKDKTHQIVKPTKVINELIGTIFQIKHVLDAVLIVVGFATVLTLVLVIMLSLRLRQREVETMFKLGCSRRKIAGLLSSEISIILLISFGLASVMTTITSLFADEILFTLIL